MAYEVTLHVISKSLHTHGVVAGFLKLAEQGIVNLRVEKCFDKVDQYPTEHLVEAVVDGKVLAFDMLDGYNWDTAGVKEYLKNCDVYFKRSFSRQKTGGLTPEELKKLRPLGCSYHVVHPKAGFLENRDPKSIAKEIYHSLHGEKPMRYFTPERFETEPEYKEGNLSILFFTRLWESWECPGISGQELDYINRTRIDIIRGLLEKYPHQARAGVNRTPLSEKMCPDLILPQKDTVRNNYLNIMKNADICIGSMGLHESVGWKTGEYIAAARAIVNETLHYEMTGNFADGENYLSFTDADSCLKAVETLVSDPKRVYEMKKRNREYYRNYLRPDMQVLRALEAAAGAT